MIVWLASYPRSGNTLFRTILWHRHGLKTYSVYRDPDLQYLGAASTVGHAGQARLNILSRSSSVSLVKTHEFPDDDRRAVYIVRDGRDAFVSHAHYQRAALYKSPRKRAKHNPGSFEEVLRRLILAKDGGWSGHVDAWMDEARGGPARLVRYEDLLTNPETIVDEVVESFALKSSRSLFRRPERRDVPTFEELNRRWPEFFRRGRTESWRDEMSPELHELFWEHHGSTMRALDYER